MKKIILLFFTCSMVLFVSGVAQAIPVVGNGTESGGDGPREYYYEITLGEGEEFDYFHVGTECGNIDHYSNIIIPTNWTFALVSLSEDHYPGKTPHGTVSPGPDGSDVIVAQWSGPSDDLVGSATHGLGFDNIHSSHDVGWLVVDDAVTMDVEDWNEAVGADEGPVHGPVPEPATLCLFGLGGLLLRRRKSV